MADKKYFMYFKEFKLKIKPNKNPEELIFRVRI